MKWFRFYSETIHKPKVRRLPPALFRTWVFLLCIASENNPRGRLPGIEDIADQLRKTTKRAQSDVDRLKACRLLDDSEGHLVLHNWNGRQFDSDDSLPRVKRYRAKGGPLQDRDKTVTVTPPEQKQIQKQSRAETEAEQSTTSSAALVTLSVRCKENLEAFTESEADDLKDWIELTPGDRAEEIITYALKEAALHNVLKWRYVQSILLRLEEAGWPADLGGE